jgi:deazaflavin-dependent oxidoreductase (nitroreductase family)
MTQSAGDLLLRKGFRQLNKFMVLMYRTGLGRSLNAWPAVGGRILVIRHTGRTSGLARFTPVNFAMVDGEIYCMAGFGAVSDWHRNLMVQPEAEVWLPDGWYQVHADDVSDAALARTTQTYRLMRLRPGEARTGAGGPGDLAWVWPLATCVLVPLALRRRPRAS